MAGWIVTGLVLGLFAGAAGHFFEERIAAGFSVVAAIASLIGYDKIVELTNQRFGVGSCSAFLPAQERLDCLNTVSHRLSAAAAFTITLAIVGFSVYALFEKYDEQRDA